MKDNITIRDQGVKNRLQKYDLKMAIAEYVRNGFDAGANTVEIKYKYGTLGNIETLIIEDDGEGINYDKLEFKFKPFLDSEKVQNKNNNHLLRGKNGIGRLTFFTFAGEIIWNTTYADNNTFKKYKINIRADELHYYKADDPENIAHAKTGTSIEFFEIQNITKENIEKDVAEFLKKDFSWFLELNHDKRLLINGAKIDYSSILIEKESFQIIFDKKNTIFDVEFRLWNCKLNDEYSKLYCVSAKNELVFEKTTTLNNKGDKFFHSVYVKSSFFNNFLDVSEINKNDQKESLPLDINTIHSDEWNYFNKEINKYLSDKRKPFIANQANNLIEEYKKGKIFPSFGDNLIDIYKKNELENTIKSLYTIQPQLFKFNDDQAKTFIRLLDTIISDNKEKLFFIIKEVLLLNSNDLDDFYNVLMANSLPNIVRTIQLVQDRYKTIDLLSDLVYKKALKANEVDDLQKVIECHYWIFGEQYNLVTAAEPKFEEALRRYLYLLRGIKKPALIDHPDKLKEMDIFACRQNVLTDRIENIVIELKHPEIKLGAKEYNQVYTYLDVIRKQPQFNDSNMYWEFYLIGNSFDTTDYIQSQIMTNKPHGIKSLTMHLDEGRVKVYTKKWSEIFSDFKCKHDYLMRKLQTDISKAQTKTYTKAAEIVDDLINNSAIQPKEIIINN